MHDRDFRTGSEQGKRTPVDLTPGFTIGDLTRFCRMRFWVILFPIVTALTIASVYVQVAVPIYTARAQIIIDPRLPQFMPGRNEESLLAWDSAQVESEIAVLQSERIAAAVVSKLGLDQADDFKAPSTYITRLRALIFHPAPALLTETDRFRDALSAIEGSLSVRRAGLSYAIDISFSFPDPTRSMEVANSVAESYIADQIENRSQTARVGGEWLQKRLVSLRAQMNEAALAVQSFRSGHNYVIPHLTPNETDLKNDKNATLPGVTPNAGHDDRTLEELDASASTYRRIYESFLQSFTESVQRQSFPVSDARILTPASLPKTKSAPRVVLIYALSLLLGSLAGLGAALLFQSLDRTIRSAREVTAASGLEELGTLPRFRSGFAWRLRRRAKQLFRRRAFRGRGTGVSIRNQIAAKGRGRRMLARYGFASTDERGSAFTAALNSIRVLIQLQMRQRPLKSIGITGSHLGNGTSTLVTHLALLFADCGTRVLVIDAMFRDQQLTKKLGGTRHIGLIELLRDDANLDDAVIHFAETSMDFIGAGASDRSIEACSVTVEALEEFLTAVASRYDLILVDLPPVLPVSEAAALAGVLDGSVLVVEWGSTPSCSVSAAASMLERAQARPLGFVLSKAPI